MNPKFHLSVALMMLAATLLSERAWAVGYGNCASANSGSANVTGSGITTLTGGTPSSGSGAGNCASSSNFLAVVTNASTLNDSLVSASTNGSSGATGLTGSLALGQGVTLAATSNPLSATGGAQSSLSQIFTLAPGESVNYSFDLSLSGNTDSTFAPTASASVSLTSGASTIFSWNAGSVPVGSPINVTHNFSGVLSNATGSTETFDLAGAAAFTSFALGSSTLSPVSANDTLSLQYHLDLSPTPVPLPNSAALMFGGLAFGALWLRRSRPRAA